MAGQKKKAGNAGFFLCRVSRSTTAAARLLLDFLSGGLGGINSGIDGLASSLGSFVGCFSCRGSGFRCGCGGVGSGFSRSRGRCFGGGRGDFGGRGGGFFRLRASGKSQGKQGGCEEGRFHFNFLG
jgi:hypothetical protein